MSCTFPFFRGWLESRFIDLCREHDQFYVTRKWADKLGSDFIIAGKMIARGYTILGIATFFYVTTLGTIYWLWKKHRENL